MKKTLTLPDTIEACHKMTISQARLIEQLQRRSFGGSLKDRALRFDGPSLFDGIDQEATLAAAKELEKATKEVDAAAVKRRGEARTQSNGHGKRPEKYNIHGLPVQEKTVYPEGVDPDEYEDIGSDTANVPHIEPQRLWAERTTTTILRHKSDKEKPNPRIVQAERPAA